MKLDGGKNVEKGSGHDMAKGGQAHSLLNKHCRQTQPADSPPGTGLKTNSQQLAGLAAKTTAARGCRPASRRAVQVSGGSAVVLAAREADADLPKPVSTPPNAFACHCPYPLP